MTTNRRSFLMASAATAAGLAAGCTTERRGGATAAGFALEPALLDAVADVVLPTELGREGRASAVAGFRAWIAGYEPAAEELHGYGDQEIRFTPANPGPLWNAQLSQLDALARRQHRTGFVQLEAPKRDAMVRAQIARLKGGNRMPGVLTAPHVALALLSHWADSSAATDFVYGAAIGKDSCRTLATVTSLPTGATS